MSQTTQWITASRVIRRLGFGATGPEIDAAVAGGIDAYIAAALATDPADDPGVTRTPAPTLPMITRPGKTATVQARKAVNREIAQQQRTLLDWWLSRMVAAEHPTREKVTFLWHNHFATSADKVHSAAAMLAQNEKLRAMGLGEFRPLAYTMLTDAAMLDWLDGQQNTAKAPNENLAREFMELFALGHGNGYTETDVREGARALTGWRTTPTGGTVLRPRSHDSGAKTVLGVTGDLDAAGFCDAVLDHPAAAGYLATRMWRQIASDTNPSAAVVDRLTTAYGSQRNLRSLLTAIVTDPEFDAGTIVVSPVEWMVGAVRAVSPDMTTAQISQMATVLKTLGQLPFHPPSVGGWPSGQAWLSTAGAETRYSAAARLTAHARNPVVSDAAPRDRIDAVGHLLGIGAWSDRTIAVMKPAVGHPPSLTAIALNSPEYLTA